MTGAGTQFKRNDMTNETAQELTREEAEQDVSNARTAASNARAEFDAYIKEKGAAADLAEISPLTAKAATTQGSLDRAIKQLEKVSSNERWHAMAETNSGVIKLLEGAVKKGLPAVSIVGISGSVDVKDDGEIDVTVNVQTTPVDVETIRDNIRAFMTENADTYAEYDVKGLTFIAAKLGSPDQNITIRPKGIGSVNPRKAIASGGSRGRTQYNVDGSWLGPKDFLIAMESTYTDAHGKAFETALRGTGNGLSNLAKAIAAKAGTETRETPKE